MLNTLQRPLQEELVKQQKEIQRELEEREHYSRAASGEADGVQEEAEALQKKLHALNAKLARFSQQVGSVLGACGVFIERGLRVALLHKNFKACNKCGELLQYLCQSRSFLLSFI